MTARPGVEAPPPGGGAHHDSRAATLTFAVLAVAAGVFSAAQARCNGTLAVALGDSLQAAVWSFGSGWVLVTFAALFKPAIRHGLRTAHKGFRDTHLRWWHFMGGLLGGTFVGIQTYTVPLAGVALFSVASVGGQTVNALLVDRLGIGPAGAKPVSRARVAVASLAFVGVAIAASAREFGSGAGVVVPVVLTLLAGAGLALQSAINGVVSVRTGQPLTATWINFFWGTALLLGVSVGKLLAGAMQLPTSVSAPWWAFLGGVIGVTNVAIHAALVRHLGVLVMMLLGLSGQMVGALGLDLANPQTRGFVGVSLVLGVVVTLVAAIGAGAAARRDAARLAADGRMST